ncbi:MAG: MarR family transcriptional regulator [Asticcacaulis sp.]
MGAHTIINHPSQPQIVMDSLRRIVQALRLSVGQSETRDGIKTTPAQLMVMKLIENHKGLSVNALAALTFTHQSTVSELLGRLETRSLVRRERDPADGRRLAVVLTEAGRACLKDSPLSAHEKLLQAVSQLPPETLAPLAQGLEALIRAAHLSDHEAGFFFETTDTRT